MTYSDYKATSVYGDDTVEFAEDTDDTKKGSAERHAAAIATATAELYPDAFTLYIHNGSRWVKVFDNIK